MIHSTWRLDHLSTAVRYPTRGPMAYLKNLRVPPLQNFVVLYLKSKLDQKYSFRYEAANFDHRIRAAQTLQVSLMWPVDYTSDTPANILLQSLY